MIHKRKRERYRQIFFDAYGPGPWACYGCHEPVAKDESYIHHIDGDHFNDVINNLAAMHSGCHTTLHNLERPPYSEETRAKIGAASRQRTHSPETRAKMSATRLGKPLGPCSDAHRAALSAALKGKPIRHRRWRCGCCALVSTGAGLNSHQRTCGHTGRILCDN